MKKEVLVITSSNNKQGNSNFLTSLFVSKANLDLYKFSFVNLYDLNIEYLSQKNREANIEKDPASKDVRELITQIENHQKIILALVSSSSIKFR
jgi:multimeric flavodoxin WrbA